MISLTFQQENNEITVYKVIFNLCYFRPVLFSLYVIFALSLMQNPPTNDIIIFIYDKEKHSRSLEFTLTMRTKEAKIKRV